MALKFTSLPLAGSQDPVGVPQRVSIVLPLLKVASFTPVMGASMVQQTLPSLSMCEHSHSGFESVATHQVVSRLAWGNVGSICVILKNPQIWVKVNHILGVGGALGHVSSNDVARRLKSLKSSFICANVLL